MIRKRSVVSTMLLFLLLTSCSTRHEIESRHELAPIEIKPIHITIDINLKVDKALDDFFDDIDAEESKIK
ncbi:MAG: hypothetical protein KAJ60_02285 [Desulfobulbaceae bacterium]|nr:hypothetical protein [Desulfobulbaceae bacterium]MCK5339869.1 hypothetical protein [Desulfobulbaceae bacterium]MCK5405486.1 hypothetical protein [Desulfobulbaceae bacterium]